MVQGVLLYLQTKKCELVAPTCWRCSWLTSGSGGGARAGGMTAAGGGIIADAPVDAAAGHAIGTPEVEAPVRLVLLPTLD